jgi:arginine decarboxylase
MDRTGVKKAVKPAQGDDRAPAGARQQGAGRRADRGCDARLLSSIDGARRQFVREGEQLLDRAVTTAHAIRAGLARDVPELRVVATSEIETRSVGLTGYQAVSERGEPGSGTEVKPLPSRRDLRSDQRMLPRDAFFARAETVEPDEAVGRVSAELITPYPPGIPAVAPGEVFNEANVAYLQEIVANGAFVEGASDPSFRKLRVVA